MHDHDHDHGHDHGHHERPASQAELRARALEALLVERGLVSTDAIDAVVEYYENDVGPQNGARVIARAWVDPEYRARVVAEPRRVLGELGLDLEADVELRVWDSSAEVRYLVLPERPEGTDGLSEEELAALVTRDAMIGVARVESPSGAAA